MTAEDQTKAAMLAGFEGRHALVEDPAPDDDGAVVEVVARSDVSLLGQRRCLDIGYLTSS